MKNSKKYIQVYLPFVTIFFASLFRPADPDLGWHLKYGEYFFQHFSVLKENTFSTQLAHYFWPNLSWGSDLFYYIFYKLGGFFGITIGGAFIITIAFIIFSKTFNLDYWEQAIIFPILLFFLNPVNANSFRSQLLSTVFFGLLIYLYTSYEENKGKSIYFIPIIFLLWANIHGLFVVGLGVLFLWESFYLITIYLQKKSFKEILHPIKLFSIISLFSIVATLINPFGFGVYTETLKYINNPDLKAITEYLPAAELSQQWVDLIITAIIAGVGVSAFILKKKFTLKIPQIGTFGVFYALTLSVKRYAWFMYYLIIPFLKPPANFIKPESKKGVFWGATILFIFYLIIICIIKLPLSQFTEMNWDTYCQEMLQCSPKAATALRKYYVSGKTMTLYNWGGWMIWNYPDMKPSTDGRMHLWRDKNGFSAFEYDYKLEQNVTDINNSMYNVVFTATYKPIYMRLVQLTAENKWKLRYRDQFAAIFTRNE